VAAQELPDVSDTENALASLALQYPSEFAVDFTDAGMKPEFIHNVIARSLVLYSLGCSSHGEQCDITAASQFMREAKVDVQFHVLSSIWSQCPSYSVLGQLIRTTLKAAKARAIRKLARDSYYSAGDKDPDEILAEIANTVSNMQVMSAGKKRKTLKTISLDALNRYQHGEDLTNRVQTGFENIDKVCPIEKGDYIVIGGPTKSGKSFLALNIICNIIQNETRKLNSAATSNLGQTTNPS
jgi:replicative DNA helicase